ncbi:SRPBCC family protein [Armatimonas sp.]|uniref:type II toxin-antitoxin system RatA family toxin n=1 Tax=Armatimonas sp. TaxID=1872638 RepID=UPI00286A46AB|nr:SRPBCC family protein [Armatimonas sp.]
MPRIENTILIRTGRDATITIARDNEAFPEFMDDVESVSVLTRSDDTKTLTSEWVGIVPKLKKRITWIEEDVWDPDQGILNFKQVSGDFDEFHGTWTFTEIESGLTRFDSVLTYRLEIPLVGALINAIIHKTMQNNVEATQQAIKKRCESGV